MRIDWQRYVGKAVLGVLSILAVLAGGSLARAGSIFDDDYVPAAPPSVMPVIPPELPAPAPAAVPTPDSNPTPPPTSDEKPAPAPETPAPAAHDTPAARLPIPSVTDQARSRKLFKEAFAKELKDASPPARRAFAERLMSEADKITDNPCDRFVLLIGACDAAVEGSDMQLASRAAHSVGELYQVDAAHLSAAMILKAPLRQLTATQAAAVVDEGLDDAGALATSGDYVTAGRLLACLQPVAHDPEIGSEIGQRRRELSQMTLLRDRAKKAVDILTKNPTDPAANQDLGEYLCFANGDFEHGLSRLARGNDAALSAVARKDLDALAKDGDPSEMGNAWWDAAARKGNHELFVAGMKQRAIFWYEKAMASGKVVGLARVMIEKRLASAGHKVAYLPLLQEIRGDGFVVDSFWGLGKDRIAPGTDKPVILGGARCTHALGINPHNNATIHIDYDLSGNWRRFTGAAGVADGSGFSATLTFKIFCDDKELWHSTPIRKAGVPEYFNVNVAGGKTLELRIECAGSQDGAHCIWADPRLESR